MLGCGSVAVKTYLPALTLISDKAELVAICDRNDFKVRAAAERFGATASYTDYEEMLERANLDAMVVLTQMQYHAEHAQLALEAGLHVYLEKPIATGRAEAEGIVGEARRRNLKLACAPPMLVSPDFVAAKKYLEGGALGRVHYARVQCSSLGPGRRDWPHDPTSYWQGGGGPMLDIGIYGLQVLTGLLGRVRRVGALSGIAVPSFDVHGGPAKGKRVDVTVDDHTHLLLDFGNTVYAYLESTYCRVGPGDAVLEVYADKATLTMDVWYPWNGLKLFRADVVARDGQPELEVDVEEASEGWLGNSFIGWTEPPGGQGADIWERGYLGAGVAHLVDCILNDEEPVLSGENAAHLVDVIEKGYQSARQGRFLDVGMATE